MNARQMVGWDGRLSCAVTAVPLVPLAKTYRMKWRERFQRTLQLWPYMVPLALVYFAEYVLQVLSIATSSFMLTLIAH